MGTPNDANIARMARGIANSYKFVFGYWAEVAKGMIISKSLLPVLSLQLTSLRSMYAHSNLDEGVMMTLAMARKFRAIGVQFGNDPESMDAKGQLQELYVLGDPYQISIGISRYAFGKKTATYILRDKAAKLVRIENYGLYVFALEKPELLHGRGSGWDTIRKV